MTEPLGFAAVPNWLVRDTTIPTNVKLLFMLLSSRAGRSGVCWPSQALLAEEMGVTDRQVRRVTRTAEELGLIEVLTHKTPTGTRNQYRLVIDALGGDRTLVSGGGGVGSSMSGGVGSSMSAEEEPVEEEPSTTQVVEVPHLARGPEPTRHPSRPIHPQWGPRLEFMAHLIETYPHVPDHYGTLRRFINYHFAKQSTSKSWEALLENWVSNDNERAEATLLEGTDDLGVPRTRRTKSVVPDGPRPGDPDYFDHEAYLQAQQQEG